jgi:hypothetical protein
MACALRFVIGVYKRVQLTVFAFQEALISDCTFTMLEMFFAPPGRYDTSLERL